MSKVVVPIVIFVLACLSGITVVQISDWQNARMSMETQSRNVYFVPEENQKPAPETIRLYFHPGSIAVKSLSGDVEYNVWTIAGQPVLKGNVKDGGFVNTRDLAKGMYIIKVQAPDNSNRISKFIKD